MALAAQSPSSPVLFRDLQAFANNESAHLRSTLSNIETLANTQHAEIQQRFASVDTYLSRTDGRLELMEGHLSGTDGRLKLIESRMLHVDYRNGLASRPFEPLHVIPKQDPITYDLEYPKYFPLNIRRFWNLQKDKHRLKLVGLLEFYEFKGYLNWDGTDADSSDEDEGSSIQIPATPRPKVDSLFEESLKIRGKRSSNTLDEAVLHFRKAAHRCLAGCIGVNYDQVARVMRRLEKYQENLNTASRKRKETLEPGMERQSKSRIPLDLLIELHSNSDTSDPTAQSVLGWDHNNVSGPTGPTLMSLHNMRSSNNASVVPNSPPAAVWPRGHREESESPTQLNTPQQNLSSSTSSAS